MTNHILFKLLRESRGISQLKLSSLTGISNDKLSRFENGWKQPTEQEVKKISAVLNCDPNELVEIFKPKVEVVSHG